jgi:hypothetical protein
VGVQSEDPIWEENMRKILVLLAAGAFLSACDDATGLDRTRVAIDFTTTSDVAASDVAASGARLLGFGGGTALSIGLTGSNGTLELESAHVIMDEFELKRVEAGLSCDDDGLDGLDDSDDDCEEFEVGPSFLSLPLDPGGTTSVSADIGPGAYRSLEFEVEDLEDDADDAREAAAIAAVRDQILALYPEWPRKASMRVAGTFTPTGGDPVPFVTYFAAEIEVELDFPTPFVVEGGDGARTITVELAPADWFLVGGQALDLSQFDYATTGQVVEFEFEMENGFKELEHDH